MSLLLATVDLPKPITVSDYIITDDIWKDIAFAWPPPIAAIFSNFVSTMVTKPSLVVWKTLIYSLNDYLDLLNKEDTTSGGGGGDDENTLFMIEFTSALLCQYFLSNRLAEQSEHAWQVMQINRDFTNKMLTTFGATILSREHNVRTMNAFLNVCWNAGNFNLVCWYYCPDSIVETIDRCALVEKQRNYLTKNQWTLIEQRITNFGRTECVAALNRLHIQGLKANLLFSIGTPTEKSLHLSQHLLTPTTNLVQLTNILRMPDAALFVDNLSDEDLTRVCELLLEADDAKELSLGVAHNQKFVETLYLTLLKRMCEHFGSTKRSIFGKIDFDLIMHMEESDLEKIAECLVLAFQRFLSDDKKIRKFNKLPLREAMNFMLSLPVQFIVCERKDIILLLNVMLYANCAATEDEELIEDAKALLKCEYFKFL